MNYILLSKFALLIKDLDLFWSAILQSKMAEDTRSTLIITFSLQDFFLLMIVIYIVLKFHYQPQ